MQPSAHLTAAGRAVHDEQRGNVVMKKAQCGKGGNKGRQSIQTSGATYMRLSRSALLQRWFPPRHQSSRDTGQGPGELRAGGPSNSLRQQVLNPGDISWQPEARRRFLKGPYTEGYKSVKGTKSQRPEQHLGRFKEPGWVPGQEAGGVGGVVCPQQGGLKWSHLYTSLLPVPTKEASQQHMTWCVFEDLTNRTSKGASGVQAGDYRRSIGTAVTPKTTCRGPGGDKTQVPHLHAQRALS